MKKGIGIGIAIAIAIGVSVLVFSGDYSDDLPGNFENTNEPSLSENIENEPKQFTVELDESVGFSEGP